MKFYNIISSGVMFCLIFSLSFDVQASESNSKDIKEDSRTGGSVEQIVPTSKLDPQKNSWWIDRSTIDRSTTLFVSVLLVVSVIFGVPRIPRSLEGKTILPIGSLQDMLGTSLPKGRAWRSLC